ncbi:membrane protein [Streptomyces cyaneogriseus subsp. noncyanogenus]|uniref:Membrane protein n=1 Tax=Streptomyces cyaneogriseus subsp. noncyanogenus TaxID=477245 RepID=A0A0C5G0W4_9ACTN|nr:peptidoglycan-binding protein [Streptomyces cyaneogriseus]AJP02170.1 membrane protein [Streptomyces cyaneogriseus subsp. noncyanogenus]
MNTPVFEEFDPASDCDCPGCRHWRSVLPFSARSPAGRAPGHPAAHRALIAATAAAAAGTALGASPAAAAPAAAHAPHRPGVPAGDEPGTPQGGAAPLHGPGSGVPRPTSGVVIPATTRAQIIERAQTWVTAKVPYSMTAYWSDGYRQDCSGYVSMAWSLPGNEWTGSLGQYADRITKEELQPGDILLFHNPADPQNGSHVVIFGGWTDSAHTQYTAYEQTPPHTRRQTTPYAYWSNSASYLPYRYKGLTTGTAASAASAAAAARNGAPAPGNAARVTGGAGAPSSHGASSPHGAPSSHGVPGYPGRAMFRPGARNAYVTQLGRQLVKKGFGAYYTTGPGPRWGEADRRGVEAFQRAQGWRGGAADGYPGPETWRRLFS